ncbi:MAG: GYD domain-containing protein [Solirubrobacterales bacterium]|nr:GYD domain-containing protein [Solirubrobacterales bacterium]
MPHYISLWTWTDAGIKDVRETATRVERVKREFEKRGLNLEVYWTAGPYDGVGIMEAPDDESATAALLWLGSAGHVRTTTMRAFDANEMGRVVEKVHP